MTIEEMKAKVESMKAEIARIDKLLDDESLSNEEYDSLEKKAYDLSQERGNLQNKINMLSVKKLVRVSDWEASFLSSFSCGTRKITNKQAEIFKRFNNSKPFIYNGRRFYCQGPNYRTGFSGLVVTDISNL